MEGKKIIFIIAAGKSGSTLLDKALGSHNKCFSMGEISNFEEEVAKEKTLCGCGQWLKDCNFWNTVKKEIKSHKKIGSIEEFNIRPERKTGIISKLLGLIFENKTPYGNTKLLFDIITKISQRDIIIDSSKSLGRALKLGNYLKKDYQVYYIHLIRNGKAVLNSDKKKYYHAILPDGTKETIFLDKEIDPIQYIKTWKQINHRAIFILKWFIKPQKRYFLKYEDFIEDPKLYLKDICRILNIDFELEMSNLDNDHNHILGGNASRVTANKIETKADNTYVNLTQEDLEQFERIAGRLNKKLGYK